MGEKPNLCCPGELGNRRKFMRGLGDVTLRNGEHQSLLRPERGRSLASREGDRSLAAALHETVRSIGGLLFFGVAVLLLLYGTRFLGA
jgi:hypothetical protein